MVKAAAVVTSGEQSLAVWEPLVLEAVQQRYTNERTAKKVIGERVGCSAICKLGVFLTGTSDRRSGRDWCWTARRSSKTKGAHR